jgi:putative hydrolase of the HAD superfamily
VSDKTPDIYNAAFARHGTGADQGLMVGNSLKSDVLPMLAAGGWGVHVPHGLTWALEQADPPVGHRRFHVVTDLSPLPDLVSLLASNHKT